MPKQTKKQKTAVSPVNGQPTPRGRPFTSESAREAQRRRVEKQAAQKSITAAFLRYMQEYVISDKNGNQLTGAQAIAMSIIKGASKGNAEMVKIALAITGETPKAKIEIETGQLAQLIDGLREPCDDDLYAETAGDDGAVAQGEAETN